MGIKASLLDTNPPVVPGRAWVCCGGVCASRWSDGGQPSSPLLHDLQEKQDIEYPVQPGSEA